ncbi:hypothetical protein PsorP6_003017 [Peronosclerospora sorghi]|uniref:Uncharacterized protein n=1 Tax=Peronosclerospora sorghi TaxID=230839 RepID=A0ACC0VP04_9STRA|nr:hypothetical protein PsorP6_003017 [Peronosclerospora sorghi]
MDLETEKPFIGTSGATAFERGDGDYSTTNLRSLPHANSATASDDEARSALTDFLKNVNLIAQKHGLFLKEINKTPEGVLNLLFKTEADKDSMENVFTLLYYMKAHWGDSGSAENIKLLYQLLEHVGLKKKNMAVLFQALKDIDELSEMGGKLQSHQFDGWIQNRVWPMDLLGKQYQEKDTLEKKIYLAFMEHVVIRSRNDDSIRKFYLPDLDLSRLDKSLRNYSPAKVRSKL